MAIRQQLIAWKGIVMGRASPPRSVALIVEGDQDERSLLAALLEETEFETVECESAEAALAVMNIKGDRVAMLFTDIQLAGMMDGIELAQIVSSHCPSASVIVSSEKSDDRLSNLPPEAVYMAKPWRALDVLMIAEHARVSAR
jgi:DNA-binding NtrC family response regulator